MRSCAHCAGELHGLKPSARFCSPACKTAAYRERRAETGVDTGKDVFAALAARVTSHRPVTRRMRDRHRVTA